MAYRNNGYPANDMERDRERDREDRMSEINEKPTHIMEHLATFTVTKETGIIYPADGMRRLLQLEKANGIWSQKMQLCLDRQWVFILDESGSIVERFPVNSIQEPTAFTSHDPMEMYNNILVFIVSDNTQQRADEMHIFQCQSISAEDLVEDIKQLRMGKTLTRNRRTSMPPQSHKPPQNIVSPTRDNHYRERERDYDAENLNDDASSTTSEIYERDVTILNHCFDDIEKFIARLQHVAAATKELERRRRSRKNKKRDMGDGMLTMRTKPPPEKEFIDIFQKFKLSFNLLARLKAHIHDPNAPELVHFLFTPLALIVEASHDTYFDAHLPHQVVAPLLTRPAINLLNNCVTSKETELWHSLGNTWSIPRDSWKGHVPSYHPVFMDNWSPDYPVMDDVDSSMENSKHYREGPNDGHNSDYDYEPPTHHPEMFEHYPTGERENEHIPARVAKSPHDIEPIRDARSDISIDSIERTGDERNFHKSQESFLHELQAKGARVVQVTYPRTANNDKEMTVARGEFLEILDDTRKWWRARNSRGQVAHVPHTIVTKYQEGNENMHAMHPRSPLRSDSPSDGYPGGNGPGHAPPNPTNADWVQNQRRGKKEEVSNIPVPPPPPPENFTPTPTPMGTLNKPPASLITTKAPIVTQPPQPYNEELTTFIGVMRTRKHKAFIDIKQTPNVFITTTSNPKEIQEWLKAKNFDEDTCKKFNGFTGHQLFDCTKAEFVKVCGENTGKRLFSQITVQKKVSGYDTIKTTELQTILQKTKQKLEDKNKNEDSVKEGIAEENEDEE